MRKFFAGSILAVGVAVGAVASDYPISTPAQSIHPQQESLVLTRLSNQERKGSKDLEIGEGSKIDPRQWILIVSPDGSEQETHCVKAVRHAAPEKPPERGHDHLEGQSLLKLTSGLRRSYLGGSKVIQGSVARERGIVTRLKQAAGRGTSRLTVDSAREIDALEQVVLQSVDGRTREAHCVKAIVGDQVELVDDLFNDYQSSAAVIQGRLIDGQSEGDDNPCCCIDKRAGRGGRRR